MLMCELVLLVAGQDNYRNTCQEIAGQIRRLGGYVQSTDGEAGLIEAEVPVEALAAARAIPGVTNFSVVIQYSTEREEA